MRKIMLLATLIAVFGVGQAFGDTPLHGFCWGAAACSDNGTNTPTTANPPQYGFWISSGPTTGTYINDILVPVADGTGLSFTISGDLSGTATLVSTTSWSAGDLDGYLGFDASPNNPFGAFQGTSGTYTGGYYVYQVNFGTQTLPGAPGSPDLWLNNGSTVPVNTYIVGFLLDGCKQGKTLEDCATANSGAILETGGTPPSTVPEPGSLALFGTGLLGVAGYLRRKMFA